MHYRLELYVQSKAPDGMDINRFANFDWLDPKDAPDDKTVLARIQTMIQETEGLDKAPLIDPYAGPALLTGRASAVFFHEVFGHRAEGFRQKDINEGQTFTSKVGEQILPDFLSIKDDPTQASLGGQMLLGNYLYDDEGVKAENVQLVDHGVLKTFLMGRSPLVSIPHSNGHGRRQLGYVPVARQGNLIVSSSKTMTNTQLRQKLIDLVKEQGKPFGLLIDDIAGGFTFTGRGNPQAFQVLPLGGLQSVSRRPARPTGARRRYCRHAASFAHEDRGHRRHTRYFQWLLRSRVRICSGVRGGSGDSDLRIGSAEEADLDRPAADPSATGP